MLLLGFREDCLDKCAHELSESHRHVLQARQDSSRDWDTSALLSVLLLNQLLYKEWDFFEFNSRRTTSRAVKCLGTQNFKRKEGGNPRYFRYICPAFVSKAIDQRFQTLKSLWNSKTMFKHFQDIDVFRFWGISSSWIPERETPVLWNLFFRWYVLTNTSKSSYKTIEKSIWCAIVNESDPSWSRAMAYKKAFSGLLIIIWKEMCVSSVIVSLRTQHWLLLQLELMRSFPELLRIRASGL